MLGLAKSFVIFIIISIIFGYGMSDWRWGVWIMGIYIVVKITWRFLTK